MMSSLFVQWLNLSIPNILRLLGILILALLGNRLLRALTNLLIHPAASQSRAAQAREQQTRSLASTLYSAGSKVVWGMAILTALPEFGFTVFPVIVIIGAILLGLGFGARKLVSDLIAGFEIVFEDQYGIGETILTQHTSGKVEQLTLRRTVVRDARGALVTLANGDLRAVGNLSRDWSQAFVDITVSAEQRLEKTLQALEIASAALRSDASWSQAIIDGPRVLGLQAYGPLGPTLRVQVRTAPTRQDEVSRELRRRIQIEFQRQSIPISRAQDLEQTSPFRSLEEKDTGVPHGD
jgi:moderate conductance mechanosensitive channel